MILLNTIVQPNTLVAHALDYLAVYKDGVVKTYYKYSAQNELVELPVSYTVAGVRAIRISENGQVICVQTATKTIRLQDGIQTAFDTVGEFDIANTGHIVLVDATNGAVQIITTSTTLLTATVNTTDKVMCGRRKFVVYNGTRSLVCGYAEVVLVSETHAKKLLFVSHVGDDQFAYFFEDGTIRCKGKTIQNTPSLFYRKAGQHVIGSDWQFDYAYIGQAPQTKAQKLHETDYWWVTIKLVKEAPITVNYIGFTKLSALGAPTRFLLPTLPLKTLEANLTEITRANTPVPQTYPDYYARNDTEFSASSVTGAIPYKTVNAGNTWTAAGTAGSNKGRGFVFKGYYWMQKDGGVWESYQPGFVGPIQTVTITPTFPALSFNYWAHNANVVVASTSNVVQKRNIFISWNLPAFNTFDIGIDTNCDIFYVGMNVFYFSRNSGGSIISKLVYVTPTPIGPTILKTFAKDYDLITQIGNSIVVVDGENIRALKYVPIANESTATLAQAQAYATRIEEALTTDNMRKRAMGVQGFAAPWKQQNRLVTGGADAYQVWEFD